MVEERIQAAALIGFAEAGGPGEGQGVGSHLRPDRNSLAPRNQIAVREYKYPEASMSDTRALPAFDSILQDLRYTFRTLRRDSGFTAFAVQSEERRVGKECRSR